MRLYAWECRVCGKDPCRLQTHGDMVRLPDCCPWGMEYIPIWKESTNTKLRSVKNGEKISKTT